MSSSEIRYKRDVRLPYQEVQGQAVVVAPARREVHEFDETATFLWAALARERTLGELVGALCEEYEVDEKAAEEDVRRFLALLEEKGLVLRA
jgi:hypothetical protein